MSIGKYDPAIEWKVVRGIPPKENGNRGIFPTNKVTGGIFEYESRIERDSYELLN